ncbi:hypothetical protein DFH07DRAFT_579809 [Mycena maculata]|uniref:Uncharacterized protein n=1 Tax=Mycena maculata TaxID=230809 RepID=A0AAD7N5U3_9AGAR|nr:hypothetical protein DFH07DRAFT_579809 [Mycena maculata]
MRAFPRPGPDRAISSLPSITNLQELTLSESAHTPEPLLVMALLKHLTLPAPKDLTPKFLHVGSRYHRISVRHLALVAPAAIVDPLSHARFIPSITYLKLHLSTPVGALLDRLACDAGFLPHLVNVDITNFSPSRRRPTAHPGPSSEQIYGGET